VKSLFNILHFAVWVLALSSCEDSLNRGPENFASPSATPQVYPSFSADPTASNGSTSQPTQSSQSNPNGSSVEDSILRASLAEHSDGEWIAIATGQTYMITNTSISKVTSNGIESEKRNFSSQEGNVVTFSDERNNVSKFSLQNDFIAKLNTAPSSRLGVSDELYLIRNGIDDATVNAEVPGFGLWLANRRAAIGTITLKPTTGTGKTREAVVTGPKLKFENVETGTYTVEIKDAENGNIATINEVRIDSDNQEIGSIEYDENSEYNFKATFEPDSEFSFSGETRTGNIVVQNIGRDMARGVNYTLAYASQNLTSNTPLTGILNSLPAGATQKIRFTYTVGILNEFQQNIPISITLRDIASNEWNDRVFISVWKRKFEISLAADEASVAGFVILPDRKLKRFNISAYGSDVVVVPTVPDFEYQVVLSAPTLTNETRYALRIGGATANTNFQNFTNTAAFEPNESEAQSVQLNLQSSIQSYLHVGDVDFFKFKADTTPPLAPLEPLASFTSGTSMTFTWSNPGDDANGTGVVSYNLEIGTSAGGNNVFRGSLNALSKSISGVNGNTYFARVQAVDASGNISEWSPNSIGYIVDTVAPNTPTTPTGPGTFHNSTAITFNWTNATDNAGGSGVIAYNLRIGTSAGGSNVFDGRVTGLTYLVIGEHGSTYYARVQAIDQRGNLSPWSSNSIGTKIDVVAPIVPSAPVGPGSFSGSTITFTWGNSSDNTGGAGVSHYVVQIGTSQSSHDVFDGNVNGTSKTISGTNGQTYFARVLAVDNVGNASALSASSSGTTVDTSSPATPAAPTVPNAISNSSQVTFSWVNPGDNAGGSGVSSYLVQIGTSDGASNIFNGSVSSLSKSVTSSNGTTCYARVKAVDAIGNASTDWSETVSVFVDTVAPNAPPTPSVDSFSTSQVTFSWSNPGDNAGGSGVASYNVAIGTSAGFDNVFSGNVTGLSKTITGVNGSRYYARVQSVDFAGNVSSYSPNSQGSTVDSAAPNMPAAPIGPGSFTNSTSLTFSWTNPGDNAGGSGVVGYNVRIGTTPEGTDTFAGFVNGLSKIVSGANEQIYYASVQAVDAKGNVSAFSPSTSSRVDTVAPTVGTATLPIADCNTLDISWAAASDNLSINSALTYQIYYSQTNDITLANNVVSNATAFDSPLQNISAKRVTGLNNNSAYWLTVVVRDQAGNAAAYPSVSKSLSCNFTLVSAGGGGSTYQHATYGTQGISSSSNHPGARFGSASWIDAAGNFWLFGGWGIGENAGNGGALSDLWKFDGTNWTWMGGSKLLNHEGVYGTKGVSSSANFPRARYSSVAWIDSNSNFWMFGGTGYDSGNNNAHLNDLWKFDGTNWTWMSGSTNSNQLGSNGNKGVASDTNMPGSRAYATGCTDKNGNFWMFGGWSSAQQSGATFGWLNDLWKFDGSRWTWVSGANVPDQISSYGTKGMISSSNSPGSRFGSLSWCDSSNNFWTFGGLGLVGGSSSNLADLWKFDGTNWVWVSGSLSQNQAGSYGIQSVPSPQNAPGARSHAVHWIDKSGKFWMFGGFGIGAGGYGGVGTSGRLNDLWMFDGTNWTWVAGSAGVDQSGVYGTIGTPGSENVPSGLYHAITWRDQAENLWIFGGQGPTAGSWDDLWKFQKN